MPSELSRTAYCRNAVFTAAAAVLETIDAKTAAEMKAALVAYLAPIPDGTAKSDGVKLGELRCSHARSNGLLTQSGHALLRRRGHPTHMERPDPTPTSPVALLSPF